MVSAALGVDITAVVATCLAVVFKIVVLISLLLNGKRGVVSSERAVFWTVTEPVPAPVEVLEVPVLVSAGI